MASASGQGEVLKKRSVNLFQLNRNKMVNISFSRNVKVFVIEGDHATTRGLYTESSLPVFIDVLNLVDLLLNALAGHAVGLEFINLLVDQVRDCFMEILQEVFDHLWDDMVGLLFILPLIGQVCFRVT